MTACQALIEQLACTVDSRTNTIETLRQEKQEIELAFNLWMHHIFAKRSERYLDDPNQLKLDLGGDDNAADAAEGLAQAVEEAGLPVIRNHWQPLQTYLTDGRIPIDNNDVEQLMKQVALGRKNWLFVGSVDAGTRAADFLTLVNSAVRNDLDVWAYIKDVLDRLLAGETDYAALRPDVWRVAHPEAIRQYRVADLTRRCLAAR